MSDPSWSDSSWLEVDPPVGKWLWGVLRQHLGDELHVHETCTDPTGERFGSPYVLTVVGPREGPSIFRCEARGSLDDLDAAGRPHLTTRFFVPARRPA